MKKNLIALMGIALFAFFFTNTNNGYSQNTNEHNCTKEQMKEHNCSKETKTTEVKTEKIESNKCDDESGNEKVEAIGKFHSHIAKLWHKNYPDLNLKLMRKDTESMLKMFSSLETAKIPETFKSKEAEYKKAVETLKVSLTDLNNYLGTITKANKQDSKLTEKVEKLHNDFHTLSGMFN